MFSKKIIRSVDFSLVQILIAFAIVLAASAKINDKQRHRLERLVVAPQHKDLDLKRRVPKQIHMNPIIVNSDENHKSDHEKSVGSGIFGSDNEAAASVNVGGEGKYFQYQHIPHKDQYDFGHKRGNHHHFIERQEKGAPKHGAFKTKVRWGDKHGGYGEHYWDYNHAGHHGHDEDEAKSSDEAEESHDEDESGGYSHNAPKILPPSFLDASSSARPSADPNKLNKVVDSPSDERHKRNPDKNTPDVISTRESNAGLTASLFYDLETGTVVDQATGKTYILQPVN